MQLISFLTILLIILCQVLEVYAYFIKGMNSGIYGRQLVGLANWIQYVARINYVFVLFLISYSFEVLGVGSHILEVISISFFTSFVISISLIYFKSPRNLIHKLLYFLIRYTYRDLVKISINFDKNAINLSWSMFTSFISSMLLGLAFIMPFVLAEKYPDYRMMAIYSGQALNFLASAIIFSMLEPRMYKELDSNVTEGVVCSTASGIIAAKSFSQLVMCLLILVVI